MALYRVYVPIVRWAEWEIEAADTEEACINVVMHGKGKHICDDDTDHLGEGTYAALVARDVTEEKG